MTLSQQIGAATAVLCLVLVGMLAVSAALVSRHRVERLISDEMANFAAAVSESLDLFMHTRYQEIRALTALEFLHEQEWTTEPARARRVFEGMQNGQPHYAWIGFATRDGIVRAASGAVLEGRSVAETPWFKNGLHGPTVVDVHPANPLEGLIAASQPGKPLRVVDVAAPVLDARGEIVGVLSAHINWNWAKELRDSFLKRRLTPDTTISIVSGNGIVVLGERSGQRMFSRDQLVSMGLNNRGTLLVDDGEPMLTGYALANGHLEYPGLGWMVIAQKPAAFALAAARDTGWTILGLGAVLALFAVGASFLIARRTARPLRQLTEEADRIGRDPDAVMLRQQRGSIEMLQLSQALRSLLRRIGFAEQRTKDVEASASENARQFAEDMKAMRRLAETDPLTNLTNRRAFLRCAHRVIATGYSD